MSICFAFDCDQTLEISQGPVPISLLRRLLGEGHYVYIVSASLSCVHLDVPRYAPFLMRRVNILQQLKQKVQAARYIYVGDNINDELSAKNSGWEFIYAKDFLTQFS